MGLSPSVLLTEKDLVNYQELTYFNKQEILQAYRVFRNLKKQSIRERGGEELQVPVNVIMNIPELKVNPFRDRLCSVFSNDKDYMNFEEFLDMMSVLSSNAPKDLKAHYAFNVYDFNNDQRLCEEDLMQLLDRLTSGLPNDPSCYMDGKLSDKQKKKIIKEIFAIADLDRDQELSFSEFCHIIDKSPDFITSFIIHL